MTDAPAIGPAPGPKLPASDPPAPDRFDSPPPGRGLLPVLTAIGFLILAAVIYYVWDNPQEPAAAQELRGLGGRVAALEQRTPPDIDSLEGRLGALEKRPVVPPAAADAASKTELTQLASRIDAVGGRADQLAAQLQAADQAQTQRMAALDAKLGDLAKQQAAAAGLAGTVAALDAKLADMAKQQAAEAGLAGKVAAQDARLGDLAKQQAADAALADKVAALDPRLAALDQRLGALDQRVAALEKAAGGLSAMETRQTRLARLQAAAAALEAGQPLGPLPGAPPALARYASDKPPTLAALKLDFPAAMRAAEEASIPSPAQANVFNRMWDRVQGLVVVRQGESVVVGNPAAGVLARAERLLDAGDLAGAAQAVSGLGGPAAAAMSGWLARAQDLLAAREAMAALEAHA